MAISDQFQMLLAAFTFGILLYAAIAAVLLYLRGHVATISNDSRRQVLVLFLTFSALWALVDFVNFAVPATSPMGCQVTIIASTLFDQAARVTIGGFLLWSVGHAKKTVVETYGLGTLMGIRIVIGGIFVAFVRPQFAPVCVAQMDMPAVSVVVMVLDMIVIGVLVIRLFTLGLFDAIREVHSSTKQEQSKALVYCVTGFCLWTLTSITMLLGFESIILLLRTTLPAVGLMILVSIMTMYNGVLVLPREEEPSIPEARSPFVIPQPQIFGGFSNNNGSPIRDAGYTRGPNLFVVNPSHTPHDSQVTGYLENIKAEDERYKGYGRRTIRTAQGENAGTSNTRENGQDQSSNGGFQLSLAAPLRAGTSPALLAGSRKPSFASAKSIDQIRSSSSQIVSTTEVHQKRSPFGWSKKPADKSARKIVISEPVIDNAEDSLTQPFAKVRTVDLATAATNERERREAAINRQLVATRPAPPPPKALEAWRKSSITRRKEVPRGISAPLALNSPRQSSNNSGLSVDVNATSTSASLSPGREDMRRRSPRTLQSVERDIEKVYSLASSSRVQSSSISLLKGGNPQTVMYVNDIVYDHPGTVKSIIKGAPKTLPKSKQREAQQMAGSPKSFQSSAPARSESILHRPRPYRRNSEKDRVLFPSDPSPSRYHRRSKSGSSINSKKSSLLSHSVGPTEMAAVPQRPKTAAELRKLLPSDTKSMTVDEKISLLFPAPPGVHQLPNRRSSVPSVPRIPSSILMGDSFSKMLMDQETEDRRASKRTTISFGRQIQNDGVTPVAETPILNEYGIYRFSANYLRTLAKSPDVSQVSTLPDNVTGNLHSNTRYSQASNGKRRSISTGSSSRADGSHDDSRSAWASIHSAAPAVDVAASLRTARESYIRVREDASVRSRGGPSKQFYAPSSKPEDEMIAAGDGEDFMTTTSGMGDITLPAPSPAQDQSFLLNPSPTVPEQELFLPPTSYSWRRRIGDELPAFSERRKHLRSRTMPPPTPLLLGSDSRRPTVVVHEPVIEVVEDTPETILKEIQAQLRRFEEPSGDSIYPLIGYVPRDPSKLSIAHSDDRLDLLENLEMEMGQQETHWMQMQHTFERDSNSVAPTPQKPLPSPRSESSSRRTSLSVTRRLRIQGNSTRHSNGGESTMTLSTQSSENSRATVWQQRLAEAQMEYMENATMLLNNPHLNFLSFYKGQLASPTPPDSVDSEDDPNTDIGYDADEQSSDGDFVRDPPSPKAKWKRPALWERKPVAPIVRVGHLWSPPQERSSLRTASPEPAAKMVRPTPRRDHHPLSIESSTLWSKIITHATRPPVGLWGSRMTRPKSIITRPKTERPTRKLKHVTFLPDILESPSPLPYKHDTLGIFQFPCGEKSDSAVCDPIPTSNQTNVQPFIVNPSIELNSRQLGPEPAEYLSSFFDDYEDYETDSGQDSEDDFDESTLWEIANLLNSSDASSTNGLLPFPRIIEDYEDDEDGSESDLTETVARSIQSSQASIFPSLSNPVPVNPFKPLPALPPPEKGITEDILQATGAKLQQPEAAVWQVYLPALDKAVRGKPRESVGQASRPNINPRILWDKAVGAVSSLPVEKAVALWTQQRSSMANVSSPESKGSSVKDTLHIGLWTMRQMRTVTEAGGLFDARIHHTDYRPSHETPAALSTRREPRTDAEPLMALKTQEMWSPSRNSSSERHWISQSTVRARTPSVFSTSSGRLSPSSDSASIASPSTTAVSPCSLNETIAKIPTKEQMPQGSDAFPNDELLATGVGDHGVLNSIQQTPKRPISLRGSRVMASRDLWESKAAASDSTSQMKTRQSSKVAVPKAFQEKSQNTATATETEWDATSTEAVYLETPWAQILSAPLDNRKSVVQEVIPQSCSPAQRDNAVSVTEYDPAVRHPVFFTSNLVSSAEIVHPAATGHVSRPALGFAEAQQSSKLWASSAPTAKKPTADHSLWTKPSLARDNTPLWVPPVANNTVRKATKTIAPVSLPTLSLTAFWHETISTPVATQHWLHTTSLLTVPVFSVAAGRSPLSMLFANTFLDDSTAPARSATAPEPAVVTSSLVVDKTSNEKPAASKISAPSIWTPPTRSNVISADTILGQKTLWTPSAGRSQQAAVQESFSVVVENRSAKRWDSSRPLLREMHTEVMKFENTELWRPKRALKESSKDWLTSAERRASKVQFRY